MEGENEEKLGTISCMGKAAKRYAKGGGVGFR